MNVRTFDNRQDWEQARIGKITGSKLKDLIVKRGTGQKIGFYQLIADRLAIPSDGENPMDRGLRLEDEAMEHLSNTIEKAVDTSLVIWERDDNANIAISPDGFIGETEAVEVKCLNSAKHIEALVTKEIPSDYMDQVTQYFVVNDKLEKLYFVFYDPRLLAQQFFFYVVERKDVADKVTAYLELERDLLNRVNEIVAQLSDF